MTGARITTTLLNGLLAPDGTYGIESCALPGRWGSRCSWSGSARAVLPITTTRTAARRDDVRCPRGRGAVGAVGTGARTLLATADSGANAVSVFTVSSSG